MKVQLSFGHKTVIPSLSKLFMELKKFFDISCPTTQAQKPQVIINKILIIPIVQHLRVLNVLKVLLNSTLYSMMTAMLAVRRMMMMMVMMMMVMMMMMSSIKKMMVMTLISAASSIYNLDGLEHDTFYHVRAR